MSNRFITYRKQKRKSLLKAVLPAVLFALILTLFILGTHSVSSGSREKQRAALENALTETVTACYALEGCYPEDLDYLKEHYGLSWNESMFYVDYRVIGGNIRPEITVLDIGKGG